MLKAYTDLLYSENIFLELSRKCFEIGCSWLFHFGQTVLVLAIYLRSSV